MAVCACQSTLMFFFLLTITLHISLLCGVISVGTDSTAVTVHESEIHETENDKDGAIETEEQEVLEIFQPTGEWQTIQEGQAIPAGLHVRINLATGEKEAKLLDEENSGLTQEKDETNKEPGNREETQIYSKEELQERLAKMKGDEDCDENTGETTNEALIEEVKKRYRSIDEIRKEFAKLELNVETDYEIMTRLIKEYHEKPSIENQKLVLQDLEFYVHQVDNAVDLEHLGGWDVIITALNSTDEEIHSEAAHVLGSAVQSNPKAQVIAFDGGAMQPLLRLLSQSPSTAVKKKMLYGLSSLLRFFPFAQQKFLQLGGLSVLSALMREDGAGKLSVQVKSVTLLHDLLIEQKNALQSTGVDDVSKERQLQYEKVNLAPAMVEQGWCSFVPALLSAPDHDTREKILLSIQTLCPLCQYDRNLELSDRLHSLRQEYNELAEEENVSEEGDDYFSSLLSLVDELIQAC